MDCSDIHSNMPGTLATYVVKGYRVFHVLWRRRTRVLAVFLDEGRASTPTELLLYEGTATV